MNAHAGIYFFKVSYTPENALCIYSIWLLVGLVRSLLSSQKRGFFGASLCEDFSDLTSPISNHYI